MRALTSRARDDCGRSGFICEQQSGPCGSRQGWLVGDLFLLHLPAERVSAWGWQIRQLCAAVADGGKKRMRLSPVFCLQESLG